ncbi:autotransporter-associated beta strand repeat-containing protein, partial [Xanthobacter agilis]
TNTYTGATVISAGTLALSGSGSIAASSTVTVDGTLDIAAISGGSVSISNLSGSAAGAITLGSKTLKVLQAVSGVYAGTISGAGSLTKEGEGTLTLTGTNTYTGGTVLGAGTLSVSSDANLG